MKNKNMTRRKVVAFAMMTALLLGSAHASADTLWRGKKSKKNKTEMAPPPSRYKVLTGSDSVQMKGVMNVVEKGDTVFLELPVKLLGKPFLVSNKLQQVPSELNESAANKGVNYENQMVRFEWDKKAKLVKMRQQRVTPEAPKGSYLAQSVADNYVDPIIATLKVEAVSNDSSTVLFKVNDLFNGKKNVLNDVFNEINIGTSPVSELSRIVSVKSYERSVVALSELTTTVHEGNSKVNLTVVVSTAIMLLPDEPMRTRREDWRVGYFSTPALIYGDHQQQVEHANYITRWRLVPADTLAYMRGELVEPVQPITFYIGGAVPEHLRPYITRTKPSNEQVSRMLSVLSCLMTPLMSKAMTCVILFLLTPLPRRPTPWDLPPSIHVPVRFWRRTSSGGTMYSRSSANGFVCRQQRQILVHVPLLYQMNSLVMPSVSSLVMKWDTLSDFATT